jgi:hypothetical protein
MKSYGLPTINAKDDADSSVDILYAIATNIKVLFAIPERHKSSICNAKTPERFYFQLQNI